MSPRFANHYVILAVILALYAVISVLTALTRQPWVDEAWFISPAINLVEKGHMGISVLEIEGTRWTRMDQYAFWQPPLYYLSQVVWYSVFGAGLISMRLMSVFWGMVALLALFCLTSTVTRSRSVALVAVGLAAIDFAFISSAADGRLDMMSAALAITGFAAYVSLREKNLSIAILTGHCLAAASGLTHPNGILAFFGIVFLSLYYDRTRIRANHVLMALVPYVLGGVGWGLYIMQDPEAFIDQFGGNMRGWFFGHSIIESFRIEFGQRYLGPYGFHEPVSSVQKLKVFIMLSYWAGVVGAFFAARKADRKGGLVLVHLFVLYFLLMAILIGNKMPRYIIYILPFYTCLLSLSIVSCWEHSRIPKFAVVSALLILCALQMGVSVRRILRDGYHNTYMPVIEQIEQMGGLDPESSIIMGSSELAFHFGFDSNVIDDPSLGYSSGKRPDVIVVVPRYKEWLGRWEKQDPAKYEHVRQVLEDEFELVFGNEYYEVYGRKGGNDAV